MEGHKEWQIFNEVFLSWDGLEGFRFVLNKADLEFLGSDKSKFFCLGSNLERDSYFG